MKKIIKISVFIILSLIVVTGCSFTTKSTKNTSSSKAKETKIEKEKSKCSIFECIKKLDSNSSLEDINKVVGFEGEKDQEGNGWTSYKWKLNEDDTVKATIFSTSTTISIDFNDDKIKNKKVDFSKFQELKTALNNREVISYDEVVEKFGGVEGTLIEISSYSNKYKWVNSEGGYLNASFNKDNTRCSMIMGMI